MFKKELMPKCPYCGWEMRYHFDYPMEYCDVQFYCKHCNAMSPSARGSKTSTESVEKTLEEAYEKAMRLYEEPNRILTIEEIKTYKGFVWCENIYGSAFAPAYVENQKLYVENSVDEIKEEAIDSYGIVWRFWLRKPSEKERESVCWKEKK